MTLCSFQDAHFDLSRKKSVNLKFKFRMRHIRFETDEWPGIKCRWSGKCLSMWIVFPIRWNALPLASAFQGLLSAHELNVFCSLAEEPYCWGCFGASFCIVKFPYILCLADDFGHILSQSRGQGRCGQILSIAAVICLMGYCCWRHRVQRSFVWINELLI